MWSYLVASQIYLLDQPVYLVWGLQVKIVLAKPHLGWACRANSSLMHYKGILANGPTTDGNCNLQPKGVQGNFETSPSFNMGTHQVVEKNHMIEVVVVLPAEEVISNLNELSLMRLSGDFGLSECLDLCKICFWCLIYC